MAFKLLENKYLEACSGERPSEIVDATAESHEPTY